MPTTSHSQDTSNSSEEIKFTAYKNYNKSERTENEALDTGSGQLGILWSAQDKKKYTVTTHNKVTVYDVAEYILQKTGTITTMKLHKLLYYAQAWSLVWDDNPLFEEEIEAWANGPVIRDLFCSHRGQYSISKLSNANPDLLTSTQKETIDSVLAHYGDKSTQWLVELTHMEDPWRKAREGLKPLERGNKKIPLNTMVEYYSSL